jgi:hypothetical protein
MKNGKRRSWTTADVRTLKSLARKRTRAGKIAKTLKRTEGATRQKAFSLGVSLDARVSRLKCWERSKRGPALHGSCFLLAFSMIQSCGKSRPHRHRYFCLKPLLFAFPLKTPKWKPINNIILHHGGGPIRRSQRHIASCHLKPPRRSYYEAALKVRKNIFVESAF